MRAVPARLAAGRAGSHDAAVDGLSTRHPCCHELARQLGETVHLAALDRDRVLYVASVVPAGGVAAPAVPVAAELTPLGQVLSTEHRGVLVGPQRALDGVACAAAAVRVRDEPAGSIGVCAPNERFATRRDMYARAVGTTQKRVHAPFGCTNVWPKAPPSRIIKQSILTRGRAARCRST